MKNSIEDVNEDDRIKALVSIMPCGRRKGYLGDTLREFRKLSNLSQAQVAESANISRNQFGNYESGEYFPSVDTLITICEAMDVDPLDVFSRALYKSKQDLINKKNDRSGLELLKTNRAVLS